MNQLAHQSLYIKGGPVAELMQLSFGSRSLLMARDQIRIFHSNYDIQQNEAGTGSVGWIQSGTMRLPVYSFTDEFTLSDKIRQEQSICVVVERVDIAFMCDEIKVMDGSLKKIVALPACIAVSATPIENICLYHKDNQLVTGLLCSADSIKKCISRSVGQ